MKKKNFINYCGLLGVAAFISYTAAVVFSPLAYPGYNWMAQAVSDLSGSDAHFVNGNRCIVIYHITNLNHYFRDKKQKLLFLWGICRNSTWNDDGWCICMITPIPSIGVPAYTSASPLSVPGV